MRTLLVTSDFPPVVGGIQSYLRDFVQEVVDREGADSIVVFAATWNAEASAAWDAEQDYTVIRWPFPVLIATPGVARKMARIIRDYDIDTVWFGVTAPLAALGARAKRAGARRVVSTTHGHEVGWAMIPIARRFVSAAGDTADVVTYISQYTLGRIQRAIGRRPEYVALPSGVDTDFFRPATAAQRGATRRSLGVGEAPLVVCSSRLVPRKGQDRLIEALPLIREQVPNAQLVIVGEGHYGRTLRRMAGKGVTFTGRVERERLRDIVAAADVFAMPARTRGGGLDLEGLGIVYLEAQACEIPVVAGDSGGAPEAVSPQSGIVVNGRDTRAIADAITRLLLDDNLRSTMGRAGRAFVQKKYSWEVLGDRCVDVLMGRPTQD